MPVISARELEIQLEQVLKHRNTMRYRILLYKNELTDILCYSYHTFSKIDKLAEYLAALRESNEQSANAYYMRNQQSQQALETLRKIIAEKQEFIAANEDFLRSHEQTQKRAACAENAAYLTALQISELLDIYQLNDGNLFSLRLRIARQKEHNMRLCEELAVVQRETTHASDMQGRVSEYQIESI